MISGWLYSLCHAPTPAWAKIEGAARDWDSFTLLSDIGGPISINKSIYMKITCKTTTVVVVKMSCTYTCLSPIYLCLHKLHYYKKLYIYITKHNQKPTSGGLILLCWPCQMRNASNVLFNTYTDETPVLSL